MTGLRTGVSGLRLNSITGGYEVALKRHPAVRNPARHGVPFFNSSSGLKKERTRLTAAAIVKFLLMGINYRTRASSESNAATSASFADG